MVNKTLKVSALLLLLATVTEGTAQVCHNLYPYAEGVVFDNNGHDLAAFIKSNSKDVAFKAGKIRDYSGGKWGYLQVNNARVPSINIHPSLPSHRVDLNHSESINATLALFESGNGIKATWWARQCNNPNGPLFYKKTEDEGKLTVDNVRYGELTKEMDGKSFTLVEYNDTTYNDGDYGLILKNYILLENLAVKDAHDYKTIIDFYNNFLSKFSYTEDPLLENKSFITAFSSGKTRYWGYVNMVNGKLGAHLQVADFQFEKDRDALVENTFHKLTGKSVYIYGDDMFGTEKTILKYGHQHPDLKLTRRKTDTPEKFNKEK
jgi:hypothetical protein